jgi:hypothetical protein
MKTLKQRMKDDLKLRRLSPRTQLTYLVHVTRFARYFNKLPDKHGEKVDFGDALGILGTLLKC